MCYGIVQDAVYQGDSFLLHAQLADGSMIGIRGISTRGAMAALPRPGDAVRLGLAAEDTVLLAEDGL